MLVDSREIVFQEWMFTLPMQQQSVLLLAARGPDGVGKFHPTKDIVVRYRASVLKQAYHGRAMRVDEGHETTFMSLEDFSKDILWDAICKIFFNHVDELPHHYYMHLMHGAQIIGAKHPDGLFRKRWTTFYYRCCHDLHLNIETNTELDNRLNDWDREHWDLDTPQIPDQIEDYCEECHGPCLRRPRHGDGMNI